MAPTIQLPSIVMAARPVPSASPPQPESMADGYASTPSWSIFWTKLTASTFSGLSAIASVPSSSTRPPPACSMKTPMRWYSGPKLSPTWSPVVRVLAAASRLSQSVGMSASVRPAAAHASVLMTSPSVEKSLGAQ